MKSLLTNAPTEEDGRAMTETCDLHCGSAKRRCDDGVLGSGVEKNGAVRLGQVPAESLTTTFTFSCRIWKTYENPKI